MEALDHGHLLSLLLGVPFGLNYDVGQVKPGVYNKMASNREERLSIEIRQDMINDLFNFHSVLAQDHCPACSLAFLTNRHLTLWTH